MAEEQKEAEQSEGLDPNTRYFIHNTSRGRHNRTQRTLQPGRQGLKQYLGGGELRFVRGQPMILTGAQLKKYMKEVKEKVAAGLLELRTADGRVIELDTGKPSTESMAPPPLPTRRLDSIANDIQNIGNPVPQFPGGVTHAQPGDEPELLAKAPQEILPPAADPYPEPHLSSHVVPQATDEDVPALMGGGGGEDQDWGHNTTEHPEGEHLPDEEHPAHKTHGHHKKKGSHK